MKFLVGKREAACCFATRIANHQGHPCIDVIFVALCLCVEKTRFFAVLRMKTSVFSASRVGDSSVAEKRDCLVARGFAPLLFAMTTFGCGYVVP